MLTRSIAALVVSFGLAGTSFAAKAPAATKLNVGAVKAAYLNAMANTSYGKGPYVKLTGSALKAFKSQAKDGGSDFPNQVITVKSKAAKGTAGILTVTDGGSYLSVIKMNKGNTASKVLATGSGGESEDFTWNR